ncbi:MAG TPA: hypothetical protein VK660_07960 [Xanthomonadaceae bacterium]|jgi:hypothetical protein|nr:hypothetical protein [Xanthomonadaceae bacterium]
MRDGITLVLALALGLMRIDAFAQNPAASPTIQPAPQGTRLDLEKPFHARSPWLLVVTEGVPVKDYGDFDAPGALTLCLQKGPAGRCLSDPVTPPLRATTSDDAIAWEPHYLLTAKVVYPRGPTAAPFLLLVTGSLNSGDGDQLVATQLLAYDSGRDAFHRVYSNSTGRNNNQEIRFIDHGPLRGSVITAEPQEHLPYNYWIVVDTLTQAGAYRQALRYRSATHQNDGNPLAVIDSEMPTIERRLGLWKPGEPLPSPASAGDGKPCAKPTLRDAELWCE